MSLICSSCPHMWFSIPTFSFERGRERERGIERVKIKKNGIGGYGGDGKWIARKEHCVGLSGG